MPIISLLTPSRPSRPVGGLFSRLSAAALRRPAAAPASVVEPVESAPAVLPPLAEIVSAAEQFAAAADDARAAERAKRKARKLLDALPVGRYGAWIVSRTESSRQTVDLEAVRATYARLGLGELPLKPSSPSLKVERAVMREALPTAAELLSEVAA